MIDAKELRIGNLVKWVSQGDETAEFWMRLDSANLRSFDEGNIILHPIPLTPELLIGCGFIKGDYHDNWFSHVELSPHIVVYDDWLILETVDDIRISEPFKYLHQLQNLYYALNQKELEINHLQTKL